MKHRYILQIKFQRSTREWDIEESAKSFAELLKYRNIIDGTVSNAQVVDLLTHKKRVWK